MKCSECRWWCGKVNDWGDCHRVITTIQPDLLTCHFKGMYFKESYDPHDFKYWKYHPRTANLLKKTYMSLPKGVRQRKIKEDDVVFDDKGGSTIRKVTLTYLQTRRDYECEEEYGTH